MNTTAYNQFAKEIAHYINYHCDGENKGLNQRGCRGLLDGSELGNRERAHDGSGRMG